MLFRLKPEIYLVTGVAKDALCNVVNGDIISLNKELSIKLRNAECNLPIDKDEYIEKLIEMGWGEEFESPIYVDKLRYTNKFNKKRAWKVMPALEVVSIQLTNNCGNLCKCRLCESSYCPMCVSNGLKEELSVEKWYAIFEKLDCMNPKTYILTGGNPVLYIHYEEMYKYLVEKGYNVITHVPDLESAKRLKGRQVFLSCFDRETFLMAERIDNIVTVSEYNSSGKKNICVNMNEPHYKKSNLATKKDFASFFTRTIYDSCLLGKVSIMSNGDVVPCFGLRDFILGNAVNDNMRTILKKLYDNWWSISVDEREHQKCIHCEFRYNCSSCVKMSDNMCAYDVEEGIWKFD